tara:strand:+ start:23710 stop:24849 length:1140 start_codon:yes stop_codon:yes gene_type:complete
MNPTIRKLSLVLLTVTLLGSIFVVSHKNKPAPVTTPPPVIEQPGTPIEIPSVHSYEDALASITLQELQDNLEYLASDKLEGRMSGKKGNVAAAAFIKEKYESFGLKTMYDRFGIRRVNPGPHNEIGDDFTQNIYAWIPGNDPQLKNEIVVIGAHMDHIGYGPSMSRSRRQGVHNGADDNASGTVALMELAEAFSLIRPELKRTVVFQSYSAEEMGLIGARHYCSQPKFPLNNPSMKSHVFMLNMDMIGYLGQGVYATSWVTANSSIDVGKYIRQLNSTYSFANKITSRGSGGSDHAPFYNKRVPVAFLHTGLHAYYHTPDDDADRINFAGLHKVSQYAFELAYKVVQSDDPPQFNVANFEPMPYIHDHGHGVAFPHFHD